MAPRSPGLRDDLAKAASGTDPARAGGAAHPTRVELRPHPWLDVQGALTMGLSLCAWLAWLAAAAAWDVDLLDRKLVVPSGSCQEAAAEFNRLTRPLESGRLPRAGQQLLTAATRDESEYRWRSQTLIRSARVSQLMARRYFAIVNRAEALQQ